MDELEPAANLHPVTEPRDEAPPSSWPKAIGVISLIYALLGMTCITLGAVGQVFLMEFFMKMGGLDIVVPPFLKVFAVVALLLSLPLGIYMFMGAVALLRRRPEGVTRLKRWAVIRIILLVLLFPSIFLTADMQVELQRQQIAIQTEKLEEAGRSDLAKEFDEDAARRRVYIQHAVANAIVAIYPFFLAFFLSRKKIEAEVAHWD